MISYILKDKCVFLDSDSSDNPIIPHFDSEGNVIAKFEPPYTIVEGVSAKINGKTATVSLSGKKGNFITFKIPVEAVICLAAALEEIYTEEDSIISNDMIEDLQEAINSLSSKEP